MNKVEMVEFDKRMLPVALFSPDRKYRYTLWRVWGDIRERHLFDPHFDYYGQPNQYIQFIGLNPSTADEVKNDPTVTRCISYAKAWGFGAMCMTNLFAYRATDPKQMKEQADPVGVDNDAALKMVAGNAAMIIACWGNNGVHLNRAHHVLKLFRESPFILHHLGLTSHKQPKHPLYLHAFTHPLRALTNELLQK